MDRLDRSDAVCTAPQIEEHLSLQVPFTVIFEYPTIRLLATHVLDLLTNPDSASLREPETGVGRRLHVPWLHAVLWSMKIC